MQQSASCHENELPQLSFPQTKSPSHSLFLSQSPSFILHGLLLVQQSLISDSSPQEHFEDEHPESSKREIYNKKYKFLLCMDRLRHCISLKFAIMYLPSTLAITLKPLSVTE